MPLENVRHHINSFSNGFAMTTYLLLFSL